MGLENPAYNYLRDAIPAATSLTINSTWDRILRTSGRSLSCVKNLTTAAGANNSVNLYSFTGSFKIVALLGIIIDVTDIADFDDVGFDLYDGTNTVQLSVRNPGGLTLDGFGANSFILLAQDATNALTGLNSDQVRISQAGRNAYQEAYVNPKNGVTNYLRISYDSASIDVTMVFGLVFTESTTSGYESGLTAV